MSVVHLIINPASGAKATEDILKEDVLPLFKKHTSIQIKEHRTTCEGDGVRIAKEILDGVKQGNDDDTLRLVLLGGDGTIHEVLNGIVQQREGKCEIPCNVKIALVPTGTANAVYASLYPDKSLEERTYKLKSIQAMLSNEYTEYPQALFTVASERTKKATISVVVTSHALHASILADSEALRSSHPGIERFKIAATQNMSRWTLADLELKGRGQGDTIQLYDPTSSTFKDISPKEAQFSDPIIYFICVTIDRLEPSFVVAPYSGPTFSSLQRKELQRPSDAVDILLIRPLRDPALQQYTDKKDAFWLDEESNSVREDFAQKTIQQVVKGMYSNGKHIDLQYDNIGPYICEYYRCGGYKWIPVSV